jgi:hypothetical protein
MPTQERLHTVAHNQFIDDLSAHQTTQGSTIVLAYPAVSIMKQHRTHQSLATIAAQGQYIHESSTRYYKLILS